MVTTNRGKKMAGAALGICAVVMLGAFAFLKGGTFEAIPENKTERLHIGSFEVQAEVVSSREKMERGLGERDDLCLHCAMLFDFHDLGKRSFWMKGMRFPLDIVWIANGRIVHIEKNISPDTVEIFSPDVAADMVLEVNQGISDSYGWKIGDMVRFGRTK